MNWWHIGDLFDTTESVLKCVLFRGGTKLLTNQMKSLKWLHGSSLINKVTSVDVLGGGVWFNFKRIVYSVGFDEFCRLF